MKVHITEENLYFYEMFQENINNFKCTALYLKPMLKNEKLISMANTFRIGRDVKEYIEYTLGF